MQHNGPGCGGHYGELAIFFMAKGAYRSRAGVLSGWASRGLPYSRNANTDLIQVVVTVFQLVQIERISVASTSPHRGVDCGSALRLSSCTLSCWRGTQTVFNFVAGQRVRLLINPLLQANRPVIICGRSGGRWIVTRCCYAKSSYRYAQIAPRLGIFAEFHNGQVKGIDTCGNGIRAGD